tara:strand:- start:104316 stop:105434 length:1119 start_codon:yes stop_codon:yes gene_type:complete
MSRRYRAGIIGRTGKGNYGHGLDTVYLKMEDVDIIAVADDDTAGLQKAGKRLGVTNLYTDYREMLRNEWFDIVSICPRWLDQHAAMTLAVADSGASIFLEKPIARSLAEADTMIEACEKAGVMMGIAHQGRMHVAGSLARRLLAEGVIGDILNIRMRGKEDHRGGGEDLMVLGTHLFDMLRFLIGRNPIWVQATVSKTGGQPINLDDVEKGPEELGLIAGDAILAVYGFGHGVTATFETRRNQKQDSSRYGMWIYGSEGIMTVHESSQQIRIYESPIWHPDCNKPVRDVTKEALQLSPSEQPSQSFLQDTANVAIVRDIFEARRDGRRPINSGYDGRWALEMIHGIYASHLSETRTALPLENRDHPLLPNLI